MTNWNKTLDCEQQLNDVRIKRTFVHHIIYLLVESNRAPALIIRKMEAAMSRYPIHQYTWFFPHANAFVHIFLFTFT